MTIVIPVHNRERIVVDTLKCIGAQTLRPLSVVLVDNNSTDRTLAVLNEWADANRSGDFSIKVVEETHPGAAAARNRGLREVETPFTMFFDSDDLMAADHCAKVAAMIAANPEADIVGWNCRSRVNGRDTKIIRFYADGSHWGNIHHGGMSTQRYCARTSLFKRVGGWNSSVLGWDDVELGMRLLLANPVIVKMEQPHPTVTVIYYEDSITGGDFSGGAEKWEHALRTMDRTAEEVMAMPLRWHLLRQINLRRAILAGDYEKEGNIEGARNLMRYVLLHEPSHRYHLLYRLARRWRAAGFPGVTHLLRPFFP